MEKAEIAVKDVVKVHLRVVPSVTVVETDAHRPVGHFLGGQPLEARFGDHVATEELAGEHLHAHDCEDEPEDKTDEQDVGDGGDRLDECVHDDLRCRTPGKNAIARRPGKNETIGRRF